MSKLTFRLHRGQLFTHAVGQVNSDSMKSRRYGTQWPADLCGNILQVAFFPKTQTSDLLHMLRQQIITQLKGFLAKRHAFGIKLLGGKRLNDLRAKLQTIALCLGNLSHYLIAGDLKRPALKMTLRVVLVRLATQNQVRFLQDVFSIRAIWKKSQYVGIQGSLQCGKLAGKIEWHQIVRHYNLQKKVDRRPLSTLPHLGTKGGRRINGMTCTRVDA
jgi:hypothetical protein